MLHFLIELGVSLRGEFMKTIRFGRSKISTEGPCYVIAEIGHNHQGNLENALKMIKVASSYGVQAVKFQKRDNKTLYTKAMYKNHMIMRTATERHTVSTGNFLSSVVMNTRNC